MTRLIQLHDGKTRRIAIVQEPRLRLLNDFGSIYDLATAAIETNTKLPALIEKHLSDLSLDYDPIYRGESAWKILPPIDHPTEPSRMLISGTGLTHLGSARNRQAMHTQADVETDSMRMFRWGVERGRPDAGCIGVPPEWFYKGSGEILRAHGQPLTLPSYGEDGGEEGEIAGVYLIDAQGHPRRIGMAPGNEFSDHRFEKKNYLNLAGSKVRQCSLGPELAIDPKFDSVPGEVTIERDGQSLWKKSIATGEKEMCHNLANIEHHHFKFGSHRRPGDVHVHYYGACALSFGDGIELADGDVMQISFERFGRPLRNPLRVVKTADALVSVDPLA
jgi:hypothetical protein